MKKLYFILALCLLGIAAHAQSTINVNATGASGSYKTGYTSATTGRTDGDMLVVPGSKRGWAVFDLSVLPVGAMVTDVNLRFNFSTSGTGTMVSCALYGYNGDLSTVTTASTLYADCASGTAFNTNNWGASMGVVAQVAEAFNTAGVTFVGSHVGSIISIGYVTSTGTNQYTIVGEGGTSATQPQLQITYTCPGLSGVSATATPDPICSGGTLHLTGAATGAASYSWAGPAMYSSTNEVDSLIAAPTSLGIYTFTATNSSGCPIFVTIPVSIRSTSTVPAISGASSLCSGASVTLSDGFMGGVWSSLYPGIATVDGSGHVTGVSPGIDTIKYLDASTGCSSIKVDTVIGVPSAPTGPAGVCIGVPVMLEDSVSGGTWSSSATDTATISPSGLLTGLLTGTATISYTNTCGTATKPIIVYPVPAPITGTLRTCPGATVTLADTTAGGLWSTSNTAISTAAAALGIITGVAAGNDTVIYTVLTTGCKQYAPFLVNPLPLPIAGVMDVCPGTTTTLYDSPGGTWASLTPTIVSINSSGQVTGLIPGTATLIYTLSATGCFRTDTVDVHPLPAIIDAPATLCALFTDTLKDASTGGTWMVDSPMVARIDATTGALTGVAVGNVTVTYTLTATGCKITTRLLIHPAPVPHIIDDFSVSTFSADTYFTSYQWYFNGNPVPGAVSYRFAAANPGIYNVVVTDTLGCRDSAVASVFIANVGVPGVTGNTAIKVYPNPAHTSVYINSSIQLNAVMSDAAGREVIRKTNVSAIDISSLESGIYFLSLYNTDGDKIDIRKIVKE